MIKLVEIIESANTYHLREIVVNSSHIISMISDDYYAGLHSSGKLPEGLHEAQQFSKVTFTSGKEIVVVGSPDVIGAKAKNILHG